MMVGDVLAFVYKAFEINVENSLDDFYFATGLISCLNDIFGVSTKFFILSRNDGTFGCFTIRFVCISGCDVLNSIGIFWI